MFKKRWCVRAIMTIPPRDPHSHKGQNGRVLIIGGSEDYPGAPTFVGLSALATLRSGADLVTVAAPKNVAWAINCIAPDIITKKLPGKEFETKHVKTILNLAKTADVVVIGNGILLTPNHKRFMKTLIKKLNGTVPLVLDAGALHVVRLQDLDRCVLLPHGGELAKLLKNSSITEREIKKHIGTNVLVKKGYPNTEIISKNKRAINETGNAGMTHGGTGDVLAGIIAGLIGQGAGLFASASLATYVNGKAADLLYEKTRYGYIASDLVDVIPLVLKNFWNRA